MLEIAYYIMYANIRVFVYTRAYVQCKYICVIQKMQFCRPCSLPQGRRHSAKQQIQGLEHDLLFLILAKNKTLKLLCLRLFDLLSLDPLLLPSFRNVLSFSDCQSFPSSERGFKPSAVCLGLYGMRTYYRGSHWLFSPQCGPLVRDEEIGNFVKTKKSLKAKTLQQGAEVEEEPQSRYLQSACCRLFTLITSWDLNRLLFFFFG